MMVGGLSGTITITIYGLLIIIISLTHLTHKKEEKVTRSPAKPQNWCCAYDGNSLAESLAGGSLATLAATAATLPATRSAIAGRNRYGTPLMPRICHIPAHEI